MSRSRARRGPVVRTSSQPIDAATQKDWSIVTGPIVENQRKLADMRSVRPGGNQCET